MARLFREDLNDLPLLPAVDWQLCEQLEALLTPYLIDRPLWCRAEGNGIQADETSIATLRQEIAGHEDDVHTVRVNVNATEESGTHRLLEAVVRTPASYAPGGLLHTDDKVALHHVSQEARELFKAAAKRAGGAAQPRPVPVHEDPDAWLIRVPKPHNWLRKHGDDIGKGVVVGVVVAAIVALWALFAGHLPF